MSINASSRSRVSQRIKQQGADRAGPVTPPVVGSDAEPAHLDRMDATAAGSRSPHTPHLPTSGVLAPGIPASHALTGGLSVDSSNPVMSLNEPGSALATRIRQIMADAVQSAKLPGLAVSIGLPDGKIWTEASGVADLDSAAEITPATKFNVGSLTKTFVAATVMKLKEEGFLSLDDPISQHLPDGIVEKLRAKYDPDSITVRQLLNHTHGMASYTGNLSEVVMPWYSDPSSSMEPAELIDAAMSLEPVGAPGEKWQYGNTGYALLGILIENVTGGSWQDAVKKRTVDFIGLKNTLVPKNANPSDGPLATGYHDLYEATHGQHPTARQGELVPFKGDPSYVGAAGCMVSTTPDMVKWISALMEGRVLGAEAQEEFMTSFKTVAPDFLEIGNGLFHNLSHNTIGHPGNVPGFDSFTQYQVDAQLPIAAVTNRSAAQEDEDVIKQVTWEILAAIKTAE